MTAVGVRRAKAALSSGCKPHLTTAPAGSNRSSHGGILPNPPRHISTLHFSDVTDRADDVRPLGQRRRAPETPRRPSLAPLRHADPSDECRLWASQPYGTIIVKIMLRLKPAG